MRRNVRQGPRYAPIMDPLSGFLAALVLFHAPLPAPPAGADPVIPAPPTLPAQPATPAGDPPVPPVDGVRPKREFPPPGDPTPRKPAYPPKSYDCRFTSTPPVLDGRLDDAAWLHAPWTDDFVDIQGPELPSPRYRTRLKMLWDQEFLYIGVSMEEPHLWATLRNHDDIVFRDNDIEIFIDPDGDAREYYEIEANAFGTIFDLYLHRRYKEEGPAEHGWHCEGLRTAIHLDGTLNDPTDRDKGWSLEWAIPWSSLKPPAWDKPSFGEKERGAAPPKPLDEWRINFSRVQWMHNWEGRIAPKPVEKPIDNRYNQPPPSPDDGPKRPTYEKVAGRPEDNWVWSPQWQIDMHDPRWWGVVRFVQDAAHQPVQKPVGDPAAPRPAQPLR